MTALYVIGAIEALSLACLAWLCATAPEGEQGPGGFRLVHDDWIGDVTVDAQGWVSWRPIRGHSGGQL